MLLTSYLGNVYNANQSIPLALKALPILQMSLLTFYYRKG